MVIQHVRQFDKTGVREISSTMDKGRSAFRTVLASSRLQAIFSKWNRYPEGNVYISFEETGMGCIQRLCQQLA